MAAMTLFQRFVVFLRDYFAGSISIQMSFILEQFEELLRFRKSGYKGLTGSAHAVVLAWIATYENKLRPTIYLKPGARDAWRNSRIGFWRRQDLKFRSSRVSGGKSVSVLVKKPRSSWGFA
jgi:hypothetical protein